MYLRSRTYIRSNQTTEMNDRKSDAETQAVLCCNLYPRVRDQVSACFVVSSVVRWTKARTDGFTLPDITLPDGSSRSSRTLKPRRGLWVVIE